MEFPSILYSILNRVQMQSLHYCLMAVQTLTITLIYQILLLLKPQQEFKCNILRFNLRNQLSINKQFISAINYIGFDGRTMAIIRPNGDIEYFPASSHTQKKIKDFFSVSMTIQIQVIITCGRQCCPSNYVMTLGVECPYI